MSSIKRISGFGSIQSRPIEIWEHFRTINAQSFLGSYTNAVYENKDKEGQRHNTNTADDECAPITI